MSGYRVPEASMAVSSLEEDDPRRGRRPRVKLDRESVTMQVARVALTLRSLTLIVENLVLDLGLDIGMTPSSALKIEEHGAPKTPAGAKVHLEPTIEAWASGASSGLSSKLDDAASSEEPSSPSTSPSSPANGANGAPPALKRGMRAILEVLAAVGMPLSKQRVATLTGLSIKSGTFSDYLSALKVSGRIKILSTGDIALTDVGASDAPSGPKKTDAEIRAMWEKKLKRGQREMLAALASVHPRALSLVQLATIAGMSSKSGTFSDYLSKLRTNALIIESGDGVALSDEGKIVAPPAKKKSREDLIAFWERKLKKAGARRMLHAIVANSPDFLTFEQIGKAADISDRSGTFSDYVSILRSNGLIETSNRAARAGEAFR